MLPTFNVRFAHGVNCGYVTWGAAEKSALSGGKKKGKKNKASIALDRKFETHGSGNQSPLHDWKKENFISLFLLF